MPSRCSLAAARPRCCFLRGGSSGGRGLISASGIDSPTSPSAIAESRASPPLRAASCGEHGGPRRRLPVATLVGRVPLPDRLAGLPPRKSVSCDPSGAAGGRLRPGLLPPPLLPPSPGPTNRRTTPFESPGTEAPPRPAPPSRRRSHPPRGEAVCAARRATPSSTGSAPPPVRPPSR